MKGNSNKIFRYFGMGTTIITIGLAMSLHQDTKAIASENEQAPTTNNYGSEQNISIQEATNNKEFKKNQPNLREQQATSPQKQDANLSTIQTQDDKNESQNINYSNQTNKDNADNVKKDDYIQSNIKNPLKSNIEITRSNDVNTVDEESKVINSNSSTPIKENTANKIQSINTLNNGNKQTYITNKTVENSKITTMKVNSINYSTANDALINKQKAENDSRLKSIKGNSTFKNDHDDLKYEGILSIETDRITYKPGDIVRVYTEYNKTKRKPTYSETIFSSYRTSGWSLMNPPYYFDTTSLVARTTTFNKKTNGNWESLTLIKLPEKMVDDAFLLTVNSWNDYENEYTRSIGGTFNNILIKVINDTDAPKLGGYDESAFDESTSKKDELDSPKIIQYKTDKKVYNPNDTVKMSIEIKDKNELMYIQAILATKDPDNYKDGSSKYIPMNFANFTRNIKQLSNGNWEATLEFDIPSYAKNSTVTLENILSADKYGNDNSLQNTFGQKLFIIERTENIQPFTVEPVADFSKEIRGKATSNMTIYAFVNNKQIGNAKVVDGKYFMDIPIQKAGSKISLYTINKYNNKSKVITTTVLDKTPPKKPTINQVTSKSTVVSGKGEAGSTIYLYNGKSKVGQAVVDKNGNYKINIKVQKSDSKITLYSVDKSKNKSTTASAKVLDKTPPKTPSVSKVTSKSKVITGKGEIGSTVYIYNGNKKVGQATVSKNGTYKLSIKAQKKGSKLKIYAVDKAKNKGKTIYSTVK